MTITTDHAASSFGIPVILSDSGSPLDYAPGITALRSRLDLTQRQLAEYCGVSVRTVQDWEQGRYMVSTAALNVMAGMLAKGG